jgi:hypothetical protein
MYEQRFPPGNRKLLTDGTRAARAQNNPRGFYIQLSFANIAIAVD